MKKWLASLFGLFPFAYGLFMTVCMNLLNSGAGTMIGPILAGFFLLAWAQLSKIAHFHLCNVKKTILFMHIPALLVFGTLAVNAMVTPNFLPEWLLVILLYYAMPTLPLGFLFLFAGSSPVFLYALCLLFMLTASYMGCTGKRRCVK